MGTQISQSQQMRNALSLQEFQFKASDPAYPNMAIVAKLQDNSLHAIIKTQTSYSQFGSQSQNSKHVLPKQKTHVGDDGFNYQMYEWSNAHVEGLVKYVFETDQSRKISKVEYKAILEGVVRGYHQLSAQHKLDCSLACLNIDMQNLRIFNELKLQNNNNGNGSINITSGNQSKNKKQLSNQMVVKVIPSAISSEMIPPAQPKAPHSCWKGVGKCIHRGGILTEKQLMGDYLLAISNCATNFHNRRKNDAFKNLATNFGLPIKYVVEALYSNQTWPQIMKLLEQACQPEQQQNGYSNSVAAGTANSSMGQFSSMTSNPKVARQFIASDNHNDRHHNNQYKSTYSNISSKNLDRKPSERTIPTLPSSDKMIMISTEKQIRSDVLHHYDQKHFQQQQQLKQQPHKRKASQVIQSFRGFRDQSLQQLQSHQQPQQQLQVLQQQSLLQRGSIIDMLTFKDQVASSSSVSTIPAHKPQVPVQINGQGQIHGQISTPPRTPQHQTQQTINFRSISPRIVRPPNHQPPCQPPLQPRSRPPSASQSPSHQIVVGSTPVKRKSSVIQDDSQQKIQAVQYHNQYQASSSPSIYEQQRLQQPQPPQRQYQSQTHIITTKSPKTNAINVINNIYQHQQQHHQRSLSRQSSSSSSTAILRIHTNKNSNSPGRGQGQRVYQQQQPQYQAHTQIHQQQQQHQSQRTIPCQQRERDSIPIARSSVTSDIGVGVGRGTYTTSATTIPYLQHSPQHQQRQIFHSPQFRKAIEVGTGIRGQHSSSVISHNSSQNNSRCATPVREGRGLDPSLIPAGRPVSIPAMMMVRIPSNIPTTPPNGREVLSTPRTVRRNNSPSPSPSPSPLMQKRQTISTSSPHTPKTIRQFTQRQSQPYQFQPYERKTSPNTTTSQVRSPPTTAKISHKPMHKFKPLPPIKEQKQIRFSFYRPLTRCNDAVEDPKTNGLCKNPSLSRKRDDFFGEQFNFLESSLAADNQSYQRQGQQQSRDQNRNQGQNQNQSYQSQNQTQHQCLQKNIGQQQNQQNVAPLGQSRSPESSRVGRSFQQPSFVSFGKVLQENSRIKSSVEQSIKQNMQSMKSNAGISAKFNTSSNFRHSNANSNSRSNQIQQQPQSNQNSTFQYKNMKQIESQTILMKIPTLSQLSEPSYEDFLHYSKAADEIQEQRNSHHSINSRHSNSNAGHSQVQSHHSNHNNSQGNQSQIQIPLGHQNNSHTNSQSQIPNQSNHSSHQIHNSSNYNDSSSRSIKSSIRQRILSPRGTQKIKKQIQFPSGGYYYGQVYKEYMHGQGRLYYPSRKLAYQGDFSYDKFHGSGHLFNEQPCYISKFDYTDFGKMQVKKQKDHPLLRNNGSPRNANSQVSSHKVSYWKEYIGGMNHDMKHGKGVLIFTNDERFEGQFQNDLVEGVGIFYSGSKRISGRWKQNQLVEVFK